MRGLLSLHGILLLITPVFCCVPCSAQYSDASPWIFWCDFNAWCDVRRSLCRHVISEPSARTGRLCAMCIAYLVASARGVLESLPCWRAFDKVHSRASSIAQLFYGWELLIESILPHQIHFRSPCIQQNVLWLCWHSKYLFTTRQIGHDNENAFSNSTAAGVSGRFVRH